MKLSLVLILFAIAGDAWAAPRPESVNGDAEPGDSLQETFLSPATGSEFASNVRNAASSSGSRLKDIAQRGQAAVGKVVDKGKTILRNAGSKVNGGSGGGSGIGSRINSAVQTVKTANAANNFLKNISGGNMNLAKLGGAALKGGSS